MYSHFRVIMISNNMAAERRFEYPCEEIEKKDVKHFGHGETGTGEAWSMYKKIHTLDRGDTLKLAKDSTWCAVGLQSIIQFAQTKGIYIEFWVSKWFSLSYSEKLATYNDKYCHELNSYLKFHDPKFFDTVVKPFIKNKLTKTWVDLCLLDDDRALECLGVDIYDQLN